MNDDLRNFPVYIFTNYKLIKTDEIKTTADYNHFTHNMHHFIEKKLKKSDSEFYERVKHLQKLILITKELNLCINNISPERFLAIYGIEKHKILFSRKLWREGVYD